MGDNKKWTRRAAVGSLVSGGGLLLFGTGGSTQITSNRDVTVNTGDDEDAVVRFVDRSENADVVDSPDGEEVYVIEDGVGKFNIDDVSVSDTTDSGNDSVRIEVVEDEENSKFFSVKAACPSEPGTLDDDFLRLLFELDNGDQTITATRTTNNKISFDCGIESYDYGNFGNYRDNTEETSNSNIPPGDDAKGEVLNPERLNQRNEHDPEDRYATLKSESEGRGNDRGAKIGFDLRTVSNGSTYKLTVKTGPSNINSDWIVYLVNYSGNQLTSSGDKKSKLKKNSKNEFVFKGDEGTKIKNNSQNLYLIFETTGKGKGKTIEVDYFELKVSDS